MRWVDSFAVTLTHMDGTEGYYESSQGFREFYRSKLPMYDYAESKKGFYRFDQNLAIEEENTEVKRLLRKYTEHHQKLYL